MINMYIFTIFTRLCKRLFTSHDIKIIKRVFKIVSYMLKRNGTLFTIKYLKQSRLLVTRYLCGRPILVNSHFISTVGGFPRKFLFLKKYIDSRNIDQIRFCLTLFNLSKAIVPKRNEEFPLDLTTITNYGPEKFYTIPSWFIKVFIMSNSLEFPHIESSFKDFELNLKSGPHGPSAISIASTVRFLTKEQLDNMRILCNNSFVDDWIIPIREVMKRNFPVIPSGLDAVTDEVTGQLKPVRTSCSLTKHELTGRLSIVHDVEAKERIVAISDYYSQIILKHYHNAFMSCLTQMPCDRTYTQDPFHNWTGKDPYYSLDLSAATDRFPVELQRKLLSYLLPYDKDRNFVISNAWKDLLVKREYGLNDGPTVKYAVGQPMGSYSSWAAFTLAHHLSVQWAACLCGKYPFTNYIMLGDDIVIRDSAVARKYMKVMHRLGVSISPHKTHVSKDTYEFAKRWIRYTDDVAVELSPLPIKGLAQNFKNPFILFSIIYQWYLRTLPITKPIEIVDCLVSVFKGLTFKEPNPQFTLFNKLFKVNFGSNSRDAKACTRLLGVNEFIITHYNINFLKDRLSLFKNSMRLSLGLMTEDEGRSFLLSFLPEGLDGVQLSSGRTITTNGVNRVLCLIIFSQFSSSENKLFEMAVQFENYFRMYGMPSLMQLRRLPLWQSITNWSVALKETIDRVNPVRFNDIKVTSNDVNYNIVDLYKRINFIDMDKLTSLHRNFHSDMVTNAMLWVNLRRILKGMDLNALENLLTDRFPTNEYDENQNSYELELWLKAAYQGWSTNMSAELSSYDGVKSSYEWLHKTTGYLADVFGLSREVLLAEMQNKPETVSNTEAVGINPNTTVNVATMIKSKGRNPLLKIMLTPPDNIIHSA